MADAAGLPKVTPVFVDINALFGSNSYPELVYDEDAIRGSIYNILTTPIGSRPFVPEYGSHLYKFLQEPITDENAQSLYMMTTQAIRRWEPRVELLNQGSYVQKLDDGFLLNLRYYILPYRRLSSFQLGLAR